MSKWGRASPWFWHHFTTGMLTTSPGPPLIRHIHLREVVTDDRDENRHLIDWDIPSDSIRTLESPGIPQSRLVTRSASFEDLKKARNSSPWITSFGQHRKYDALTHEDRSLDAVSAVLLPLLPNLSSVKIDLEERDWMEDKWGGHLECLLRNVVHNYTVTGTWGVFQNLASLTVMVKKRDDLGWMLQSLVNVMALSSMRRLTANRIVDAKNTRDKNTPTSNVTHIKLLEHSIRARALKALVKGGTPLEDVHLTFRRMANSVGHMMSPVEEEEVGEAILANARTSLRKLVLLYETGYPLPTEQIHLQKFTQLTDITIRFGHKSPVDMEKRLAKCLPSSLERLELHVLQKDRIFQDVVEVLEERKRFPALKEIVIRAKPTKQEKGKLDRLCKKLDIKWSSK